MSVQSINRNQNESIYSKTAKAAGIGGAAGAAGSYLRLYSRLQDRKDEFLPGQAVINEYAKQEAEKIHNSPEAAALKKISEELAAQAQETAPDEVKLKTISDDLAAWTKENLPEDETLKKYQKIWLLRQKKLRRMSKM